MFQVTITNTSTKIETCLNFMPELSKMAKSPNSCGNSSQKTATEMEMPANIDSVNAAPIDKPDHA